MLASHQTDDDDGQHQQHLLLLQGVTELVDDRLEYDCFASSLSLKCEAAIPIRAEPSICYRYILCETLIDITL